MAPSLASYGLASVADECDNADEAFLCILMGHVADALEGFAKG